MGGTLHEVHHTPELETAFCQRALDLLSAHGIALPITADNLAPLLHENAEAYKHWSEQTRLELPSAKIWSEYYLKDFQLSEELLMPVSEELSWMYDAIRVQNVPRPNMRETIRALHREGLKIGIISNIISTTFVPRILEDYGIADLMSCVILSSTAGIRKPDAAIFEKAAAAKWPMWAIRFPGMYWGAATPAWLFPSRSATHQSPTGTPPLPAPAWRRMF